MLGHPVSLGIAPDPHVVQRGVAEAFPGMFGESAIQKLMKSTPMRVVEKKEEPCTRSFATVVVNTV